MEREYRPLPEDFLLASGASVSPASFSEQSKNVYKITDYGASVQADAVRNTGVINELILRASKEGGGRVIVPEGIYPVFTICMQSHVTLHLEKGSVLRAEKPGINGGNYLEPEINRYAGIQDHGHTYLANSLVYGTDLEWIAITGEGVFDGSNYHNKAADAPLEYILDRWDPQEPENRNEKGHRGKWFGNKGIALVRCEHVLLTDFSFLIGGHFALILSGCKDIYIDRILVDTIRDALDLDCCQNVTLRNSVFNSLNDDAICLKASFGAEKFMPVRNILVEDCKVMGFDAGSVFAGAYTRDKVVATDRCGPTGRVKFGTEASCGCDTVIVRRVEFIRSRGLCLESCDTAQMHDILVEDCTMNHISSSPIFIRLGVRNRFPVTGEHTQEVLLRSGISNDNEKETSGSREKIPLLRIDNPEWILPNTDDYEKYPIAGYFPAVNRTRTVSVDGLSDLSITDETAPCRLNPDNYVSMDGKYYPKVWDGEKYIPDFLRPINEKELVLYGNAYGAAPKGTIAKAWNIVVRNVMAKDVDPRYPVLLQGLSGSRIRNVVLENIGIEYRGGITMEMAAEQRQLNTLWNFSQFGAKPDAQYIPWLVNTFFARSEALLPRYDWNKETHSWDADPYNVPEMVWMYPEPSNLGILPAYGLYARHVEDLTIKDVRFLTQAEDERDGIVLDDALRVQIHGTGRDGTGQNASRPSVTKVRSAFRRPAGFEMVPDYPYHEESVEELILDPGIATREVVLPAPAPGTPPDSLYPHPTAAIPQNGFRFRVPTQEYPLPRTVHRPFVIWEQEGDVLKVTLRDPAGDRQSTAVDGWASGEMDRTEAVVEPQPVPILVEAFLTDPAGKQLKLVPDESAPAYSSSRRYCVQLPENYSGDALVWIRIDDGVRMEWQEIHIK